MTLPLEGPLLGIDPGTKRVGIAVLNILDLVTPVGCFAAEPRAVLLKMISAAAHDRGCVGLVVGLPINMDGSEGPAARAAREFGAQLAAASGLPVDFCDERLTSFEAEHKVGELGLTRKKRKARVDALAAAGILQAYLEERRQRRANGSA